MDDYLVGKEFPRGIQAFMLRYYLGHTHEEILEIMSDSYKKKSSVASDLTHVRKGPGPGAARRMIRAAIREPAATPDQLNQGS